MSLLAWIVVGGVLMSGIAHTDARRNVEHFLAFSAGMGLLLWLTGLAG